MVLANSCDTAHLVLCCAEVDATRADLNLRLAKLDELHDAYQHALGLKLQSEDGEKQQWMGLVGIL